MAIYNLSYGKLKSLVDHSFSPGTENAIIDAIKSAGIVTSYSGKTGVEVEKTSGSYAIPNTAQIFLDTGADNKITINDDGAKLIAAGDGSNQIIDNGPGGDTLVGGSGAESLNVTHGDNELIGGSGANTLIGGAGNDTLIGGGSSSWKRDREARRSSEGLEIRPAAILATDTAITRILHPRLRTR